MDVQPVILGGRWVRHEPLSLDHVPALARISSDREVWQYLTASLATEADVEQWVASALINRERGEELPFVTLHTESGEPIGSTRYMDVRPAHYGVEIGSTWLGKRWWRTRMNSESKYLLLRHAFEELGCIRVCLKTDLLNVRSQRAIERLGAKREGVLRKHMIVLDGRARDTVYFSIVDDEWPDVRARMERELYGEELRGE